MAVWRLGALNERDLNAAVNLRNWAGFELPGVRTWRPCKTGNAGGGR